MSNPVRVHLLKVVSGRLDVKQGCSSVVTASSMRRSEGLVLAAQVESNLIEEFVVRGLELLSA